MKDQAYKRFASFIWRASMMGLAAAIAFSLENLDTLELAPGYVVILGLILGEISKAIHNYLSYPQA